MTEDNSDKLTDFKIKVAGYTCIQLCEIIASNRYLGMFKDEALICMVELVRRRVMGDEFNFEAYIDEIYKKLPPFKLDLNALLKIKFGGL